ncbi:MAG: glutathione S-transferase family protein [Alphaproteobacteria bacterium]|nr:glutathione S-transferase family protein [Alphaproteobacteria bacterium]
MIKLITFRPAYGLPDPSPFVVKAMMLLKMAGLAFEVERTNNPRRGPKGKLPAIEDGGKLIGDSELIRRHIEQAYGFDFDRGLTPLERANAHAYARMIEERLYWVMVHARWIEPEGWARTRRTFFDSLPPVVRSILPALIQRKVRGAMHAQGTGRHTREEIYDFGVRDARGIAAALGDKPYFMGPEPSGADCTVYPFVSGAIDPAFDNPVKTEMLGHQNLVAYAQRVKARFFG